ncbi:arylsulfatase, partial [Singulisphaera rosea]
VLPALLGESPVGRDSLVEHSGVFGIRLGPWKLIEPGKGPKVLPYTAVESGVSPEVQLYNLTDDLGETHNLSKENPDKVRELQAKLKSIRHGG